MWVCYMVRCSDGSLYAGMTNDLKERIKEHNWGVKSEFTTMRRPIVLIWQEEQPNRETARKREKEIKGWSRRKKLELFARGDGAAGKPFASLRAAQGKGE